MAIKNNVTVFYCLFLRRFFTAVKDKILKHKEEKKMKVLIATKNPGKVEGASRALKKYFENVEITGISASSNVSEQPIGRETYQGALNRVNNLISYAKENNIKADLFMAVESGMIEELGFWSITNIAVIKNAEGQIGRGASASFPVPNKLVESIKKETLGTVMDNLFSKSDLHNSTGGIGLLTKEALTRIDLTEQAFIMALTQFINKEIWCDEVEIY